MPAESTVEMISTCVTTNLEKASSRSTIFGMIPQEEDLEVVFVNDGDEFPPEGQEGNSNDHEDDGDLDDSIEWDDDNDFICHEDEEDEDNEEDEEEEAPPQLGNEVPFWFSHEEADQISGIIEYYSRFLDLESERKLCIRAPKQFIGRVKRTRVENEMFSTLDEVSIYLRDFKPLGVNLPLVRTVWQVTSWDVVEGIPVHAFELRKDSLRAFWYQRTIGTDSYLYCRPLFQTSGDWQFEASDVENQVAYASLHSNFPTYGPYIPSKRSCASLEDN